MHYNTYYRKDVWEKFKDEKKKSDLINSLLAEYYGQTPMKPYDMSKAKKTSITKELSNSTKEQGGVVKPWAGDDSTWELCTEGHKIHPMVVHCPQGHKAAK